MNITLKQYVYLASIAVFASCVPSRQFDDIKIKNAKCEEENSRLKAENLGFTTKNQELSSTIEDQKKQIRQLVDDTTTIGTAHRRTKELYNELNTSYQQLVANNEKLLAHNQDETKKVIGQLQMTQEELQKKQDELNRQQEQLQKKETTLNDLQSQLKEREAKVNELNSILAKKDSTVNALKKTVSNALTRFEGNGLTVSMKNGKVYVSLEEQLLFASGSIVVDKKGIDALKKLANVLEKNTDINVLIEGHTDNVPLKGSGEMKDNWDLSVLRATSVVKILLANGDVAPVRLTPAGKSEFMPVDKGNSAEARKKNRRIEIILTPKLDELFNAIETH